MNSLKVYFCVCVKIPQTTIKIEYCLHDFWYVVLLLLLLFYTQTLSIHTTWSNKFLFGTLCQCNGPHATYDSLHNLHFYNLQTKMTSVAERKNIHSQLLRGHLVEFFFLLSRWKLRWQRYNHGVTYEETIQPSEGGQDIPKSIQDLSMFHWI